MARGLDAGKYFWRSGREKCFSLDIPFYRTFPRIGASPAETIFQWSSCSPPPVCKLPLKKRILLGHPPGSRLRAQISCRWERGVEEARPAPFQADQSTHLSDAPAFSIFCSISHAYINAGSNVAEVRKHSLHSSPAEGASPCARVDRWSAWKRLPTSQRCGVYWPGSKRPAGPAQPTFQHWSAPS